jgi:hypothetical protein
MRSDPESLGGTSRIFTLTYKFGWLQGLRKSLKGKKVWLRGSDLN